MHESHRDSEGGAWKTERGRLRIFIPAPTVIVLQFSGHLELPMAQHMMDGVDRLRMNGRPIDAFDDWQGMDSYETDARVALTDWVRRTRTAFQTLHLLQRSKAVSMGISVANLVLGGLLRSHTDRDSFQKALEEAIAASNAKYKGSARGG